MQRRGQPFLRRRGQTVVSGVSYIGPAYDSGDWTFTRASEASFWDPRESAFEGVGAAAWLADNVPRVFSDGAVLIEGERTNLWISSADMDDPPLDHFNSPTVTAGDATAPDGSLADEIAFAAGGADGQVRDLMPDGSFTNGSNSQISVFLKDPDAGTVDIYFRNKAASNDVRAAVVMGTDWARYVESGSNGTGSTDPLCGLIENTDGADFHCWGFQVEPDANFPSSPIRTSGAAAATRAAESLSGTAPTEMVSGSYAFDVWPAFSSADLTAMASGTEFHVIGQGTSTPGVLFRRNSTNIAIMIRGTGQASIIDATWAAYQKLTITVDLTSDLTITLEGATTGDDTDSAAGTMPTGTLVIGDNTSGTDPFFGVISRIRSL